MATLWNIVREVVRGDRPRIWLLGPTERLMSSWATPPWRPEFLDFIPFLKCANITINSAKVQHSTKNNLTQTEYSTTECTLNIQTHSNGQIGETDRKPRLPTFGQQRHNLHCISEATYTISHLHRDLKLACCWYDISYGTDKASLSCNTRRYKVSEEV